MTGKLFEIVPVPLSALWVILAAVLVCLLLTAFLSTLVFIARHVMFDVNTNGLLIKGGIYTRSIPKDSVLRGGIRILDLRVSPKYKIKRRLNGLGLKKLQLGWFRLENGEKALVFLSDSSDVVYIPTREGYALLISPLHPNRFIQAINELW